MQLELHKVHPNGVSAQEDTLLVFESPLDFGSIVSQCHDFTEEEYDLPHCRITMCTSPVGLLFSNDTIDALSTTFNCHRRAISKYAKNVLEDGDSYGLSTPLRMVTLAGHILCHIEMSCQTVYLSLMGSNGIGDSTAFDPSQMQEIMLEEAISDFISQISCFDLRFPPEDAVDSVMQLCVGRLSVLGLTFEDAASHTKAAHSSYLQDLELIKRSQNEVLAEMAAAEPGLEASQKSPFQPGLEKVPLAGSGSRNENEDFWEDGSEESMDIIETTMRNAVERTVASILETFDEERGSVLRDVLVVDLCSNVSISFTKLMYDQILTVKAKTLTIKNSSGNHFLQICPRIQTQHQSNQNIEKEHVGYEKCNMQGKEWNKLGKNTSGSHGLIISLLEKDIYDEFGDGVWNPAKSASIYGCSRPRKREREVQFLVGDADIVFSQKDVASALGLASLFHLDLDLDRTENNSFKSTAAVVKYSFTGQIDNCSVLFASDKLQPFARLVLCDLLLEIKLPMDKENCSTATLLTMTSESFELLDLTPEGQSYPRFLTAEPDTLGSCGEKEKTHFSMELSTHVNRWKQPPEIKIIFSGIRIFLVRRFINEMLQYTLSPAYGLGHLLASLYVDPFPDAWGTPPPAYEIPHHNFELLSTDSQIERK